MKKTVFGLIVLMAAWTMGCEPGNAPECVSGTSKCESNNVFGGALFSKCDNHGKWMPVMGCEKCEGDICAIQGVECDPEGARKCIDISDPQQSVSFECLNHIWIPSLCAQGKVCHGDKCKLLNDTPCTDGEELCLDFGEELDFASIHFQCYDNQWIPNYCPEKINCDGNQCASQPCENGDTRCITEHGVGKIYTCTDEQWHETLDCIIDACDGDTCKTCTPGEQRCVDNYAQNTGSNEHKLSGYIYTCNNDKQWELTEDCHGMGCQDNACQECAKNKKTCILNTMAYGPGLEPIQIGNIMECKRSHDGWYFSFINRCGLAGCDGNTCADPISCDNPGSTICLTFIGDIVDSNVYTCTDDHYYRLVNNCKHGCNESETDCAPPECNMTDRKCEFDADTTTYRSYICESEQWAFYRDCPGGCNEKGGTCADYCPENDTKCETSVTYNEHGVREIISQLYICHSNVWEPSDFCMEKCKDNKVCTDYCIDNNTKCETTNNQDGNEVSILYTCSAHTWQFTKDCPTGCDGTTCARNCTENETKCETTKDVDNNDVSKLYTCSSDTWNYTKTCPAPCNGNTCGKICTDNDTKCETTKDAENNEISKLYTCSSETWNYTNDCPKGCNGNICKTECPEGSHYCGTSTDGKEAFFNCETPEDGYNIQICHRGCDTDTGCVPRPCSNGEDYYTFPVDYKIHNGSDVVTIPSGTKVKCIQTADELKQMRDAINSGDIYPDASINIDNGYVLASDITITDNTWTPIGNATHPFDGFFMGNEYIITFESELTANNDNYGLFGKTESALLYDFILSIKINAPGKFSNIGGLVGTAKDSKLLNIHVTGTINAKNSDNVGGVAGSLDNSYLSAIQLAYVNVNGYDNVGGIAGSLDHTNLINVLFELNTINGHDNVGGIAGSSYSSGYINCITDGNLTGNDSVGGIAGQIRNDENSVAAIDQCHSSMNVSGVSKVGGIYGNGSFSNAQNSYATGHIIGATLLGGFAGNTSNATINRCYATGNVKGVDNNNGGKIGGFAGAVKSTTITDAYAFGKVEGPCPIGGFFGQLQGSDDLSTKNIHRCVALGPVSITSTPSSAKGAGGFAGNYIHGSDISQTANYSMSILGELTSSSDYRGSYIGYSSASSTDSWIDSGYYLKSGDNENAVGNLTPIPQLRPLTWNNLEPVLAEDSTPLIDQLGSDWAKYKCTMDISLQHSRANDYIIPLSASAIVPDFCIKQ